MKKKPVLKLRNNGKARVLKGHPWVYVNELTEHPGAEFDGLALELKDSRGRFLGTGFYNSESKLAWRRISRGEVVSTEGLIKNLVTKAVARRRNESVRRLVWSEADLLPGLVVDQYEDVLVIQTLTKGMEQCLEVITATLQGLVSPREIVFRNDAPSREFEGLPLQVFTRSGKELAPAWYTIGGIKYFLDLEKGHKTGFYLDQRGQHERAGRLAKGRRVLDCFCNQGAFAFHCAKNGAASVAAVDVSEDCIALAKKNAVENGLSIDFVAANVFDYLSEHSEETFDLIVLDPPSFARNKSSLENAMRGYKQLHLKAMKMLAPGGILATYACSQHVSGDIYQEMLVDAASDVRRSFAVIEYTGQPDDHPIRLEVPESQYLKGVILQYD